MRAISARFVQIWQRQRTATGGGDAEDLVVVGAAPRRPNQEEVLRKQKMLRNRLLRLLANDKIGRKSAYFANIDQLRDEYWKKVKIQGIEYAVRCVFLTTSNYSALFRLAMRLSCVLVNISVGKHRSGQRAPKIYPRVP